jgi:hypothetical protein
MRNSLKVFAGVVIGASLMFLYHFVSGMMSAGSPLHVEIINQTSKPVNKVTFSTEQISGRKDASFMDLVSEDKIYYSRSFGGEGTCKLQLEFEDGRKLNSQESYVETRFRVVYTLFDDTIQVE